MADVRLLFQQIRGLRTKTSGFASRFVKPNGEPDPESEEEGEDEEGEEEEEEEEDESEDVDESHCNEVAEYQMM